MMIDDFQFVGTVSALIVSLLYLVFAPTFSAIGKHLKRLFFKSDD